MPQRVSEEHSNVSLIADALLGSQPAGGFDIARGEVNTNWQKICSADVLLFSPPNNDRSGLHSPNEFLLNLSLVAVMPDSIFSFG